MRFLCLLLFAIVLSSCSHVGDTSPLPQGGLTATGTTGFKSSFPPAKSPTIPFSQRNAAMQAVANKFITLPHKNPKDDFKTLASYMATFKVFAKSGVSPSGVWGVFTDGRPFLLSVESGAAPSEKHMAQPVTYFDPPQSTNDPHTRFAPSSEFPPSGGLVRVLNNNIGNDFPQPLAVGLADALKQTGYDAAYEPATVEQFRRLQNISMLFVQTHGANGFAANGFQYYSIQTLTPQSAFNDVLYADDLNNHRLVYLMAMVLPGQKVGKVKKFGLYGLTGDFFAKYVTFARGGNDLVYVSACQGASSLNGAQDFIRTLQQLGVTYYIGWTKDTFVEDMAESEAFFADRTLGEQNQQELFGYTKHPPGIQPQGAYSGQTVYQAMGTIQRSDGFNGTLTQSGNDLFRKGLGFKYLDDENADLPPYGEKLSLLTVVTSKSAVIPLLLAPDISRIDVHEPYEFGISQNRSELDIVGSFGSQSGKVTIAPTQGGAVHTLSGAKWAPGEIVVPIPPSGSNAFGVVTVISKTGIRSNQVPITMWTGTVTVNDTYFANAITPPSGGQSAVSGSGKFTSSAHLDLQLRADVHPWRPQIEATPLPGTIWFGGVMASSTGSAQAHGSFAGSQMGTTYTLTYGPPPASVALRPVSSGAVTQAFNFDSLAAEGLSPTGCSKSMNDGSGLPLCLAISASAIGAATCTDTPNNTLCGSPNGYGSPFSFGYNTSGYSENVQQIMMTMNPGTYALSLPKITYSDSYNSGDWPNVFSGSGTTRITSRFNAPVSAPTQTTPAIR